MMCVLIYLAINNGLYCQYKGLSHIEELHITSCLRLCNASFKSTLFNMPARVSASNTALTQGLNSVFHRPHHLPLHTD